MVIKRSDAGEFLPLAEPVGGALGPTGQENAAMHSEQQGQFRRVLTRSPARN